LREAIRHSAESTDPVLVAVTDTARRLPIPMTAFDELIDGVEMDLAGARFDSFDDLVVYCRCVAGSIGRLSLGVFGCQDTAVAAPLADALGVALQLTNILRDIREDLGNGRVYLPADDLARFGCTLDPGQLPWSDEPGQGGQWSGDTAGLERLIRFEVERARSWYATGLALMPMLDWRSAASAGAMAGIYLRLLDHISAAPGTVLQRRMSLPAKEKIMVAVRSLAGRTPRPPTGVPPARLSAAGVPATANPAAGAVPAAGERAVPAGEAVAAESGAPSQEKGQADAARPVAGGTP